MEGKEGRHMALRFAVGGPSKAGPTPDASYMPLAEWPVSAHPMRRVGGLTERVGAQMVGKA